MPDASLLLPSLAGLFGIANLLDIYTTTSHLPPQRENWTLPDAKPLISPCFWSSVAGACMGVLPGMTASQATVLVMGGRNVSARLKGGTGPGMDWETRKLIDMSDDELLAIALEEAEGDGEGPQTRQDLEIIAILSAVNTAVTVMVLGFLYIIGRSGRCDLGAEDDVSRGNVERRRTHLRLHSTADHHRRGWPRCGADDAPRGQSRARLHATIPLGHMVLGVIVFVTALVWFSTGWIGMGCSSWGPSSDCCRRGLGFVEATRWASSSCRS